MTDNAQSLTGDEDPDDLAGISREVSKISSLVPYAGDAWNRWYDLPHRLISFILWKAPLRTLLPASARAALVRLINFLNLFNSFDQERISRDGRRWERVRVPDWERIEIPSIWVCEFFGPSQVEALKAALASGKWPKRFAGAPGDELDAQLRRLRERRTGASGPIGSFLRPGSTWWGPDARREVLPDGIESIEVFWEALGPSLTAVVAEFRLTTEASLRVDRAARGDHAPRIVRADGRWHLYQRLFEGINQVQGARAELHNSARQWLQEKLPGVFAENNEGQMPTLDLLLTHLYDPEKNNRQLATSGYARALGIDDAWTRVVLPQYEGFTLAEYHPERLRRDTRASWMLRGNYYSVLNEDKFRFYHPRERSPANIAHAVDDGARFLLTRLAIFEFLDMSRRQIQMQRDLSSRLYGGQRPVRSIKLLRRSMVSSNVDLEAIGEDISDLSKSSWRYGFNVPTLSRVPGLYQVERAERDGHSLAGPDEHVEKEWANRQRKELRRLLKQWKGIMASFEVSANLTSSLSGIRSQRIALFVSCGSLIVALLAGWFAYLALIPGAAPHP